MGLAVRSAGWRQPEALSIETRLRIERVLSTARVLFTVVTIAVVFFDASPRIWGSAVLYAVVTGYVVFSAVIAFLARVAPHYLLRAGIVIHVADVLFAAVVTLLTAASGGPFLVFFVFVLFVAAVRSEKGAAVLAAAVIVVLFLAASQAVAVALNDPLFEPRRRILEACYLVVLTLMLVLAALHTRAVHAETEALARVLDGAGTASTFSDALRPILDECMTHFGSSQAIVVAENIAGGRLYLWTATRSNREPQTTLVVQDLGPDDREIYLAPAPRPLLVWHVRRIDDADPIVQGVGTETLEAPIRMNGAFMSGVLDRHHAASALSAEIDSGPEWRVRLLLLEAGTPALDDLYFLRNLVRRGAPVVHRAYLIRQVRSRVVATERARLARELHDGLLQSLIALEMEIEVLRRIDSEDAVWETRLRTLRDQLRHDISDVRDLMLRLRLLEMTGDDVLRVIAELVGRLRRETGIDVRIASHGSFLDCPPRTCAHLARIVQEALTNVRKHSRARSVTITITNTPTGGRLSIADDGRGFGFKGRMTLEQLAASDLGPLVIRERTRAMGGQLAIESSPGQGTRIDVDWSRGAHV